MERFWRQKYATKLDLEKLTIVNVLPVIWKRLKTKKKNTKEIMNMWSIF